MLVHTKNTFKKPKGYSSAASKKALFEYEQWLAKHKTNVKVEKKEYVPPKSITRPTVFVPSLDSGIGNATKPIEGKRYTGTSMIGIATMHKSNLVPVFQEENCKELAKMRR